MPKIQKSRKFVLTEGYWDCKGVGVITVPPTMSEEQLCNLMTNDKIVEFAKSRPKLWNPAAYEHKFSLNTCKAIKEYCKHIDVYFQPMDEFSVGELEEITIDKEELLGPDAIDDDDDDDDDDDCFGECE